MDTQLHPNKDGEVGILYSLAKVQETVRAVGKGGFNSFDKYNFRGIDGVLNAVGPALREHQVIVTPTVLAQDFTERMSKNGGAMAVARLHMQFRFYAVDGSSLAVDVWGEGNDRSDKAIAKAHSVAMRIALIQTLCLPTDEPDPDEYDSAALQPHGERPGADAGVVAQAESMTRDELMGVLRQAQAKGDAATYQALVGVGKRRFPRQEQNNQAQEGAQ